MKKIAFSGFMASILLASGAAFADPASLTTQGYVDAGLRAVYKTVEEDIDKKQDTLTAAQLGAANSGITAAKVEVYDGLVDTINNEETGLLSAVADLQDTVDGLTSDIEGIAYSGQNGIVVNNQSNTIGFNIAGAQENEMYVYKNGVWSALDVNGTFPEEFNFAE